MQYNYSSFFYFLHSLARWSELTKSSLFLKMMISNFFWSSGAVLNHNPINKPAKNNKRTVIAAVFHYVDPVQKDS